MIAFVFAVGALSAATETPTLQQVLARVAEYVEAFEQQLSGIVLKNSTVRKSGASRRTSSSGAI